MTDLRAHWVLTVGILYLLPEGKRYWSYPYCKGTRAIHDASIVLFSRTKSLIKVYPHSCGFKQIRCLKINYNKTNVISYFCLHKLA